MLFTHLLLHPKWSVVSKKNHLLEWLLEADLLGALPRRLRHHSPHCHGLWPLCGHLSLCTTWSSGERGSTNSWWWWLGLEESYLPLCKFSSRLTWLSVVSMSLIISRVIYSHSWKSLAVTLTRLEWWWQPTVRPRACSFFSCSSSPT